MKPDRNRILEGLNPAEAALVARHGQRVSMRAGDSLNRAGEPIRRICFPEGGVISIDDKLQDGTRVGLGIVGSEGMIGWPILLGAAESPYDATVALGNASAVWLEAETLLALCAERPALRAALLGFVSAFMRQMGRTIASNLLDSVEARLARWLLMNHQRIEGDRIALTHRQLGVMLGVRRASVTDALHLIEGRGVIRATRGCIAVLDRAALHDLAGRCYEGGQDLVVAEYDAGSAGMT